jgi:transaldolase
MEFFLDTADISEIKAGVAMGLVDGITTNPSLVAKTGRDFDSVIREIFRAVKGPINLEVVGMTAPEMLQEAKALLKYGENTVIKVPMTGEGLKAVRALADKGVKTNVTLIFSATQALLAAKAGASYVSPFIGRLDDISQRGMDLIEQIVTIYNNYAFDTKVLVASVRNPVHVLDAALIGADVVTVPYKVLTQLAKHPLTDKGIDLFLEDWKKVPPAPKGGKGKGKAK